MNKISEHPLIQQLLLLGLPESDFAIFGSGPMMAHGIKDCHDLDILARGTAWSMACLLGQVAKTPDNHVKVVLADGKIEVFNKWWPGGWDTNVLIDGAEVIDGVRFVTLPNVLRWKKMAGRPKDEEHVKLIEAYLAKKA
jgi:hypothetical protein